MNATDLHARLTEVFRKVFKDTALEVGDTTTAADVAGWDSLAHITLIAEIEGEFGVKFKLKELMTIDNVGDLERLLAAKVG